MSEKVFAVAVKEDAHRQRLATSASLSEEEIAIGQKNMEEYLSYAVYENGPNVQGGIVNGMMNMEEVSCSFKDGTLTLRFPVQPWEANRAGFMHGGAIASAMDITMGITARFYTGESYNPTVEMDVRYLRPVKMEDALVITAVAVAAGSRITHLRAEAVIERTGKIAATSTAIFMASDSRK